MNDREKAQYQLKHRNLLPSARREKANKKIDEAKALLEDEIQIQDAYRAMDYGSLRMGHYKWAVKLLSIALEALEREQDEHIWKILHKEGI